MRWGLSPVGNGWTFVHVIDTHTGSNVSRTSHAGDALPDQQYVYAWDRVSVLLSDMQQNITTSVLNAVNLAPSYMDAPTESTFGMQTHPPFWQAMGRSAAVARKVGCAHCLAPDQ